MVLMDIKSDESYWKQLEITPKDIEFLYSFLLEKETPLPSAELAKALIKERIRIERLSLQKKQQQNGEFYLPENEYSVGEKIQFPAMNWIAGEVAAVREGNNPELPGLKVITVKMEDGDSREFASNIADHKLNTKAVSEEDNGPELEESIITTYGPEINNKLEASLEENKDIVRIGEDWFPKSLLIEFNVGHLNLAEAVLDMHGGGPLPVDSLLEQIDVTTEDPAELIQFSMNYALQEDSRFDEVGPHGIVQWFLNRLEPEYVREQPIELTETTADYNRSAMTEDMLVAEQQIDDELVKPNPAFSHRETGKDVTIALNYPHWRIGSIPLTDFTRPFFPTAIETPRVKFTLIDDEGEEISAWVVRPYNYIYGLREWYEEKELIPGSLIRIKHGKRPGEVLISPEPKRTNREWMKTLLIGADGGIVFAMLKQTIAANFNERMAIVVPSTEILDDLWQKRAKNRKPAGKILREMMGELAKLNTQGHVHAIELYAATNCIIRCSPGMVFSLLATNPEFSAVGDLYYRLSENS
jgi:hypothetical protein